MKPRRRDDIRKLDVHPKDYALGSAESRAAARALLEPRRRVQLIIGIHRHPDEPSIPFDPSQSSCSRTIWPDGSIFENVWLHATEDYDPRQLDEWILSHPITNGPDRNIGTQSEKSNVR